MTWQFDAQHSELGFSVKHMMISTVRGRFGAITPELSINADNLETSSVKATIDVQSIATGVDARDAHLKGADFFDTEKFPSITFASTKITRSGSKVTLAGNLTIKGVTKPVSLSGQVEGPAKDPWGNQRIGFSLEGELNRDDFDLGWGPVLETGGLMVGKTVKLSLEAQIIDK
jgi:polyisoprenoid-binding protein YceI